MSFESYEREMTKITDQRLSFGKGMHQRKQE